MADSRIYYRRRVPTSLVQIVGKREIWRSLETDSVTVALRRSHQVAAAIELDFEAARLRHHLTVDQSILAGAAPSAGILSQKLTLSSATPTADIKVVAGTTLMELPFSAAQLRAIFAAPLWTTNARPE